ncbi:hypothetical protein BgiBS90_024683, partial [Biomphalaria glabrata]
MRGSYNEVIRDIRGDLWERLERRGTLKMSASSDVGRYRLLIMKIELNGVSVF